MKFDQNIRREDSTLFVRLIFEGSFRLRWLTTDLREISSYFKNKRKTHFALLRKTCLTSVYKLCFSKRAHSLTCLYREAKGAKAATS